MPPPEVRPGCSDADQVPHSAQSAASRVAVEHCRVWLNWAAAQVDACLARDKLASAEMLAALTPMLGPAPPLSGGAPAPVGGDADEKMAAVIVAVQSHDRIMQGLAHVADALRALQAQLGDARGADSAESWRSLRDTQLRAFSMAQERALFTHMVAYDDGRAREPDMDPQETVELFVADHELFDP